MGTPSKRCIICRKEIVEPSREHILPEALGGEVVIHSVCRNCNNRLGERVDCLLTDDEYLKFLRGSLKIENRDGKIIDVNTDLPLYDEQGKRVVVKRGDGSEMPEYYIYVPPAVSIEYQDKEAKITISGSDRSEICKKLERQFKKDGKSVSREAIEATVHGQSNRRFPMVHVDRQNVAYPNKYIPCFYKMGYELACEVLEGYDEDPRGEAIRKFLLGWTLNEPVGDFQIMSDDFRFTKYKPQRICTAWLEERDGKLFVCIFLFNAILGKVWISDDASRYSLEKLMDKELFSQIKMC